MQRNASVIGSVTIVAWLHENFHQLNLHNDQYTLIEQLFLWIILA